MKVEIGFRLRNEDTYLTEDESVVVNLEDDDTKALAHSLIEDLSVDSLEIFLRRLFENPKFDDSGREGDALKQTTAELCRAAFEDLGWGDVTATVSSLAIDSEVLDLEGEETHELLHIVLPLQLVRDGRYMYFYG